MAEGTSRMNRGFAVRGAALAASLSIASLASAQTPEPSREQLQQELAELKARIAKLEANSAQQASAQETKATKDAVLTDADRRSKLGAGSAGWDKGFYIKSDDGNFSLRPGVQVQFRYVANLSEDADGDDHLDSGFELRRMRFRFDGNVLSPDLTYSFVFDTNRNGGNVTLLDAWARYKFDPKWAVKVGQFKESWEHEKDVTFAEQLAVERTLVDAVLGGNQTDRVQGVSLIYGGNKEDDVRAEFAIHDGANSKNTNFQDQPTGDWGLGVRGEYKLKGDWASYKDFTAKGTTQDLLVLGAGGDFTQAGDSDILRSTVDAQWENTRGLGVYGALHGNFGDSDTAGNTFDWGAVAQVGYLINKKVEVFGRYDLVEFDDDTANGDTFNELTVGANYFLGPDGAYLHRAKFTVDFVYLPDGAPSDQTGLGVLASDEDEFVLRGQFQLQI
jgi:hypothetical protein